MTIFTDGLRLGVGNNIDELHSSLGEYIGASAGEAFDSLPSVSLYRMQELSTAKGELPPTFGTMTGFEPSPYPDQTAPERPGIPEVPTDEARARVKEAGLDKILHLPDAPSIKGPALDIMLERARERRQRQATIERGPGGVVAGALGVGTSLLVSAIDPLNVAAAFIPVMGEARYAKLMADAGEGLFARAAARAQVGAASGAVGMTAIEPLEYFAMNQEGQDYSMADALRTVMYGAVLGGVLHSGGGAVADVLRARAGKPLYPFAEGEPFARPGEPQPGLPVRENASSRAGMPGEGESPLQRPAAGEVHPVVAALDDLPPRAKEDVLRASIAALHDGEPVRAGEMLAAVARGEPRLAALSAEARSWPDLPEQTHFAGNSDHGPVIEGFQDRWGDAVNWLRQAQAGDARGVLTHPEVPGRRIDVIWGQPGERGYGLAHIAEMHPEVLPDLPDRLARMHLERTDQRGGPDTARLVLTSAGGRETAILRNSWEGEKKTWLLTAYTPESDYRRGGGTPGSPSGSNPPGSTDPARSLGSPVSNNLGRRPADVEAAWRDLAQRKPEFDEPTVVEASQAAAKMAEPESLAAEPSARVAAAEKAMAEAEADYKANEAYIPDEIKARVERDIAQLDLEAKDRAEVIQRGAACLAAAVGAVA